MDFVIDPPPRPLKAIPLPFRKRLIPAADAVAYEGEFGRVMRQQIGFDILTVWYDVLLLTKECTLRPRERQPGLSMHYMLENMVSGWVEDKEIALNEGQFRLIGLLAGNHQIVFPPGAYIFLSMELRNTFLQGLLEEYPELKRALNRVGEQRSFISGNITIPLQGHILLHNIIQSTGAGPKARVAIELQVKQLLLLSLDELDMAYKKPLQLAHRDTALLHSIRAYIINNLDKRVTVDRLCEKFGISTARLKDGFRQIFHMAISDFTAIQRLEKARLLLQENITVNEVAVLLGYTEPSNFIRAFKRHTGVTPADYKTLPFSS